MKMNIPSNHDIYPQGYYMVRMSYLVWVHPYWGLIIVLSCYLFTTLSNQKPVRYFKDCDLGLKKTFLHELQVSLNIQDTLNRPKVDMAKIRHYINVLIGWLYFQNLLPERQYKFRIRAENIYGVGEPSAESEPVTVGLVDDDGESTEWQNEIMLNYY